MYIFKIMYIIKKGRYIFMLLYNWINYLRQEVMYFYYFICNFIISIYSKMLACSSYLKIRIQIKFIVFYCMVSGFVCMYVYVCV